MITALACTGAALVGFGGGVLYAVRRFPAWLGGMSEQQLARLFSRAERSRA